MLRALATGTHMSFPNAQSEECVAAVDSVTVSTTRVSSFLATLHCGALDCVQRGDCGCNAASLSEAVSYELSCVRRSHDLPGFCMMPGLRQTLPFRAGRL
jgi:hypothetical protein